MLQLYPKLYNVRNQAIWTEQMVTDQKDRPGASIPELALEYGTSESLLYNLANQGKLPGCRRLGKRFVVHRETFEDWLKGGMGDERGSPWANRLEP